MEVTCEQCAAKLNIPDEKIPQDQRVRISCPKCNSKMTLEPRRAREESAGTGEFHLKFIESEHAKASDKDAYGYSDYSEDEELGFFEEGTKLALIMDDNPDHSKKMDRAMKQLGYKHIMAPNTRDALGKMRFHHFDLVILSDGFDGQELQHSPILNHLNHVSMSVRRRVFVALMGDRFKTMDNMMAFSMSANVVINTKEVDKLSAILKRAISDNEKFYKVFKDTMVEVGKA